MKRLIILFATLPLLLAACITVRPITAIAAPTAALSPTPVPPTLPPTQTATLAPTSPTATPTLLIVEGTLTIKVNVRSGPGTSYSSLGQLDSGQKVQISEQDETGKWYRILYSSASDGVGWVAAQFVQLPAGTQVPPAPTSTPLGPTGRVMQELNVRSGPGTTFDSLGMLQRDATVSLTGKDATASWFQIVYPSGKGGHAWVTAQYIQTDAADQLPALDDYGTPVATGTPASASDLPPPAPTVGPAFADDDSAANPVASVTFSASGTRRFTYSGQVSAPDGDPADWVEFTPYAAASTEARLVFSLACSGNATLTVDLEQSGVTLPGWGSLACGDSYKSISLTVGQPYELHLVPASGEGLRLVNYVLTVLDEP